MICLVTGGAGFIGSHIVRRLLKEGQQVKVLDNFSTGKEENLSGLKDKIELIRGDLRDLERVREAVKGVEYVLHQAALPSVPRSVENPIASNEANVVGTLNLLIACRDEGVRRVIYAASSSTYGNSPKLPKVETMALAPLSPYAASKAAGEYYCQAFYHVYRLETVCLRYFNVFGPNQDPTSKYSAVISKFITAMLKDEQPVIYGDGLQSRDFTFVDNVVIANLLALEAKGAPGEVFNIACGERHNLLELVDLLNKILGKNIKPLFTKERPGEVKHSQADISKAEKILKYHPIVRFEEGLRRTVEWYMEVKDR